ncbi:MAG TPA: AMP-dependent synthetase/ligase [Solirubrobacteraceae bacterium]|nr:AMP-dependent synthetase/ligase [Solirubrobacteraceae bacterium]
MAIAPEARSHPPSPGLEAQTVCGAFQATVADRPDAPALRSLDGSVELTWQDYGSRVRALAAGLSAHGIARGDTLALMLTNRPEFNLVDCAAMHLGATAFSAYNTSSPEQLNYLFEDAQNRIVVTEQAFADRVEAARPGTAVERVIVVDDGGLEELESAGNPEFDFDYVWREVQPDDVLTLIYTSGTTGPPKGVQLTHANMMFELRALQAAAPVSPGGRIVSFLPAAHIADRWSAHYSPMGHGATVTCCPDPTQVLAAAAATRPTVFGGVPRVWEKLKTALEAQIGPDPGALDEATKAGVRAKLGFDEVEWFVSGAAPIPTAVLDFFIALGVPICELWGMSETTAVATINPRDDIRVGTVGVALPGVEVKLADDGEVLVRGANVMKGYRNMPEKTAEAMLEDGWLATGDIGEMSDDGFLTIVDRKKELIINAAGKNMSPANIEATLKSASPLIGQACVIGDRRPYNVALIVLDPDAAPAFAERNDLDSGALGALSSTETVIAAVAEGVNAANERLSRVEQIKKFKILDEDWLPGGDELTPTMKLKRKPIAEKYLEEIEALYLD